MTDGDGIWRETDAASAFHEIQVTAHTSAPDRTVLTERGNTDGWIASDVAVDLRR